jgi:hypothetical protein
MVCLGVKGGIVLGLLEKTAFGSQNRLGAHGIARKPAQPNPTHLASSLTEAIGSFRPSFELSLNAFGPNYSRHPQPMGERLKARIRGDCGHGESAGLRHLR